MKRKASKWVKKPTCAGLWWVKDLHDTSDVRPIRFELHPTLGMLFCDGRLPRAVDRYTRNKYAFQGPIEPPKE